jgi:Zn-dependent protease with chaperone function
VLWNYSHPPLADRIEFILAYDPWSGEPGPAYVK